MPIDTSIYNALLQKPKTVQDFDNEAMQAQTNRLALQDGQNKMADYQRGLAGEAALSKALASGGDVQNALASGGFGKQALAYAQQQAAQRKTAAEATHLDAQTGDLTQKTAQGKYDLERKKHDVALQEVTSFASPTDAVASLNAHIAKGEMSPEEGAQMRQSIPTDPTAFKDWQAQTVRGLLDAKERYAYMAPNANTVATNNTSLATNAATNARIAAEGSANRQNSLAVQDKITARQADPVIAPPQSNGLTGQQFLGSIDKPTADQVKALAEGRLAFPSGKALQSDYWQKMISAVSQYDPSFDAVNYNARSKTRNDFVAGKSAENIKSLNTAIAHMGQLDEQLSALGNSSSPTYNKVANWAGTNLGNADLQGKLAAAGATAEGVAGEMAKVFRSTGMSEHEINAWRQKFDSSSTPAQQKGTMQSAMHMLQGRMDALSDQYKTGMGTTAAPMTMLTPKAQATFDRLSGSASGPPVAPAPAAAPVKVASAADYNKLPSGATYVDPTGHTRRKP